MMKDPESKLVPELLRWMQENGEGERTVIVRLAYSQDQVEAAEALSQLGMTVQSSGPGSVIAGADRQAIKQAAEFAWVLRVELPRKLEMKKELGL